ncbi:GTPase domain-containing protein [Aerosakkonema sp. BLCC-F183]|uniref:GTPase domain-containing protein n=1 Tax=Aerosakkonema sp. BLCC-F183 TaxID=3342834 RepID=UPI0035B6BE08
MSVVVIGDRAVGKTSMVLALADSSRSQCVKVISPDYESLKEDWVDHKEGTMIPTDSPVEKPLRLNVTLPRPTGDIDVQLTDTPGELWENKELQKVMQAAWQGLKQKVSKSRYVILLLDPHRDLIQTSLLNSATEPVNRDDLQKPDAWRRRFALWLEFFNQEAKTVKQILICINKADLFCNLKDESERWQFNPSGNNDWAGHIGRIRRIYFSVAQDLIQEYNSKANGPSKLSFFITTKENRSMLETPWLYLAAYIAQDMKGGR